MVRHLKRCRRTLNSFGVRWPHCLGEEAFELRKYTLKGALIAALVCAGFGSEGYAATVDVFQESAPGAGDFSANPLGTIESFSTSGTLGEFYAYIGQQFSNTGSVTLTADQSHLFLVAASDGLGLFVVHDDGIASGGNAETQVDLFGGDAASFLVQDDPGDAIYTDTGIEFTARQSWTLGFTDGYVIGSLDGSWSADVQFKDVSVFSGPVINGLTAWAALSSDGMGGQTETALALVEERRVRLVNVPTPMSLPPPALWFLGFALLGLLAARRKNRV
jgi:hypothetical protein